MEHTYSFFVLRYAPNRERAEQVNIGLVIDRSPLDIRITHDLRKAIAIDATRDAAQLLDLEAQIRQLTSGATHFAEVHEGLQGFGPIMVSELGWFTSATAAYESNVDKIMRELVIPPARRPLKLGGRLNTAVRQVFQKHDLLSADPSDIRRKKVVPNFPVSERESLFADFAYRNGSLNITETVDLRVNDAQIKGHKFNEVGLKSLIATRSKKLYRGAKVYFVYAASARQDNVIAPHLALMDSYADRIFNFASTRERAAYVEQSLGAIEHDRLPLRARAAGPIASVRKSPAR